MTSVDPEIIDLLARLDNHVEGPKTRSMSDKGLKEDVCRDLAAQTGLRLTATDIKEKLWECYKKTHPYYPEHYFIQIFQHGSSDWNLSPEDRMRVKSERISMRSQQAFASKKHSLRQRTTIPRAPITVQTQRLGIQEKSQKFDSRSSPGSSKRAQPLVCPERKSHALANHNAESF